MNIMDEVWSAFKKLLLSRGFWTGIGPAIVLFFQLIGHPLGTDVQVALMGLISIVAGWLGITILRANTVGALSYEQLRKLLEEQDKTLAALRARSRTNGQAGHTRTLAVLCCAALFLVLGCMPPPPLPVPPQPVPVPTPPDPAPAPTVTLYAKATFQTVEVGQDAVVVDTLPPPADVQDVGHKVLHVWYLQEKREDGTPQTWEIHTAGGKVVASFAF